MRFFVFTLIILFSLQISACKSVHPNPYPDDIDWDYVFDEGDSDLSCEEGESDLDCYYYPPYYY
ncbi:MAG: hypothetical protein COV36_07665 [Alphaproteobacteria bacterium CG11_big_fil_rev_8_21_14_0_20_44_7]|nr:MAG: hypothetical protein COV36_07665 [Alphaproteobacteria bacterium CG11_big_fil_rev_8_21_14_0_20_44_7]